MIFFVPIWEDMPAREVQLDDDVDLSMKVEQAGFGFYVYVGY